MSRETEVSTQAVLLGLLLDRPKHGYELYRDLSQDLARVWHVGLSQLYAQLKLMEQAGLIDAEVASQASRPPRRVYHVTPAGRETFFDWLHTPTPYLRQIRVDLLARVYFFYHLSLPGWEQFLAAQRAVCQEQALRLGQLAAESQDPFRRLVHEFRRGQLEAVIAWLDLCQEALPEDSLGGKAP